MKLNLYGGCHYYKSYKKVPNPPKKIKQMKNSKSYKYFEFYKGKNCFQKVLGENECRTNVKKLPSNAVQWHKSFYPTRAV